MQEIIKYIDEIVFARTGKHLNTLQIAILKGVCNRQKYAEIAKIYNYTEGHTRDEAYALWKILSQVLGEDLNKSNFLATIERLGLISDNCHFLNSFKLYADRAFKASENRKATSSAISSSFD